MMVAFTVTARNELGDVVAVDIAAFAWPSIAYVTLAVLDATVLALVGWREHEA